MFFSLLATVEELNSHTFKFFKDLRKEELAVMELVLLANLLNFAVADLEIQKGGFMHSLIRICINVHYMTPRRLL